MKITYEQIETPSEAIVIKRTDVDGKISYIPSDEGNSDYQAYLRWLENPDAEHLNGIVDGEAL